MTRCFAEATFTITANIETLILVGTDAINGTGNAQANNLIGNGSANTLTGGDGGDGLTGAGGGDTLIGGLGNDGMSGGAGDDLYSVDSIFDVIAETAGEGIDTVFSETNHVLYLNVELLILVGTGDTQAYGNLQQNFLYGNAGNNYFDSAGQADYMHGGGGNDVYRLRLGRTQRRSARRLRLRRPDPVPRLQRRHHNRDAAQLLPVPSAGFLQRRHRSIRHRLQLHADGSGLYVRVSTAHCRLPLGAGGVCRLMNEQGRCVTAAALFIAGGPLELPRLDGTRGDQGLDVARCKAPIGKDFAAVLTSVGWAALDTARCAREFRCWPGLRYAVDGDE